MRNIVKCIFACLSVFGAVSCIENDLSYPYVPGEIISIEFEGQKSLTIDKENRTVNVVMGETADLSRVKVNMLVLTEGAVMFVDDPEYMDLREPVELTIYVYEKFVWTITAVQPIERYIKVDNQVGDAEFYLEEKRAVVYVNENQSLTNVKFNDMKLEPEGSVVKSVMWWRYVAEEGKSKTQIQDCDFPETPMTLDCIQECYFFVDYKNNTGDNAIRWSVAVVNRTAEMEIESVNPWANFAAVKGVTVDADNLVVEYRKAADSQWTACEGVSVSDMNVRVLLKGLTPETEYVVRFTSGEDECEKTFVTEKAAQLENFSFDDWYLDGKAWMPNKDADHKTWDTANGGSALVNVIPTRPEEEIVVSGKAARLESMTAFGMLAAGNIYTGQFDQLYGLGAELDWGVPFGSRPLALRGWYRYTPKPVNIVDNPGFLNMGDTDECQIQIFLAAGWTKPFHVNSADQTFVDKNDKSIVAFNEFCSSETDTEYKKFSIPVIYNDNRIPNYIVISACASRYGNYFVGAGPSVGEDGAKIPGSILYVDEFELVYDPAELTDEEFDAVFSKVSPY